MELFKLKEGVNGAGGLERFFTIYCADEIWRRDGATPIGAAFGHWVGRRAGHALPRGSAIDDRRIGTLGWRARKIDVRPKWIGDFALIQDLDSDLLSFQRFSALDEFERDCLMLDVVECITRRAALYVTAEHQEGELRYAMRSALLPTTDDTSAIAWIYQIWVFDDESQGRLAVDAERFKGVS